MRILILFSLIGLSVVGCQRKTSGHSSSSEVTTPKPIRFSSAECRFSVLMPGPPIEETKSIPAGKFQLLQRKFSVFRNDSRELFMVFYMDWPKEIHERLGTEGALDTLAKGVVADSGGRLVEQRVIKSDDIPGIEIKVDVPNTGRMTARVFQYGTRSYQVSVGMPTAKAASNEIRDFLDSFHIEK
jgi:hypothetical protein